MSRITTQTRVEQLLAEGFAAIYQQFDVPGDFPDSVHAQVDRIAPRLRDPQRWLGGLRRDLTDQPFVTLDPTNSKDLDQAFCIEKRGNILRLHYALADVAAFVEPGSSIDQEAWHRGVTIYGLAEKVPLYPAMISEGAASLLPDGPRPAILVSVDVDQDGSLSLPAVERVIIFSRAKLDYVSVDIGSIAYLEDFARRMWLAESRRKAVRVVFPEQEVVIDASAPGGVRLNLRTPLYSEQVNAALSLAINMSIAKLFLQQQTGIFRIMSAPEPRALKRLRLEAHATGIAWGEDESVEQMIHRLNLNNVDHRRFLMTVRRAGGPAGYATYSTVKAPWHFAIGAPYVHATAPMRRLADRYVLELALQLANSQSPDPAIHGRMSDLPLVMNRTSGRARSVAQAVIDLIEAVTLQSRIGDILEAEVVDADAQIVQTFDSAIRSRVAKLPPVQDGDRVRVRIDYANPTERKIILTATN